MVVHSGWPHTRYRLVSQVTSMIGYLHILLILQQMYMHTYIYLSYHLNFELHAGQDSSVGRAADCHVTGPGFNTHSKPGWGLTQPSIPLWVGKMSTSKKNIG